jgi:hypothetical protein
MCHCGFLQRGAYSQIGWVPPATVIDRDTAGLRRNMWRNVLVRNAVPSPVRIDRYLWGSLSAHGIHDQSNYFSSTLVAPRHKGNFTTVRYMSKVVAGSNSAQVVVDKTYVNRSPGYDHQVFTYLQCNSLDDETNPNLSFKPRPIQPSL